MAGKSVLCVPAYFENKVLLLPCFKLWMDFKKQYCSHIVLSPKMDVVDVFKSVRVWERGGLWCIGVCTVNVETCRAGFVRLLSLRSSISSHALFEKGQNLPLEFTVTVAPPPSLLLHFSHDHQFRLLVFIWTSVSNGVLSCWATENRLQDDLITFLPQISFNIV